MTGAEIVGPERTPNAVKPAQQMMGWGKVGFLLLPTMWALIAGADLILCAFFILIFSVVVVLHPHAYKEIAPSMAFLGGACLVFGAILIYPIRFFRELRLRKRETGSIFPSGEELGAIRYRRQHPPAWVRITLPHG